MIVANRQYFLYINGAIIQYIIYVNNSYLIYDSSITVKRLSIKKMIALPRKSLNLC